MKEQRSAAALWRPSSDLLTDPQQDQGRPHSATIAGQSSAQTVRAARSAAPPDIPRTLPQAIAAAELGARLDLTLDAAVYLHVPEPVLIRRLLARARPDDTADVIGHRLQVFAETTSPLIDYYRDRRILVEVDADRSPESITDEIQARLLT